MIKRILFLGLLIFITGTGISIAGTEITGKNVFDKKCSHCHAPGNENPGTRQLGLTRGADKAVMEQRNDLNGEYIRYIVRHGLMSMPAFVPTDITEQQMDELIRYLTKDKS